MEVFRNSHSALINGDTFKIMNLYLVAPLGARPEEAQEAGEQGIFTSNIKVSPLNRRDRKQKKGDSQRRAWPRKWTLRNSKLLSKTL